MEMLLAFVYRAGRAINSALSGWSDNKSMKQRKGEDEDKKKKEKH